VAAICKSTRRHIPKDDILERCSYFDSTNGRDLFIAVSVEYMGQIFLLSTLFYLFISPLSQIPPFATDDLPSSVLLYSICLQFIYQLFLVCIECNTTATYLGNWQEENRGKTRFLNVCSSERERDECPGPKVRTPVRGTYCVTTVSKLMFEL
jgi:hypothetical protein